MFAGQPMTRVSHPSSAMRAQTASRRRAYSSGEKYSSRPPRVIPGCGESCAAIVKASLRGISGHQCSKKASAGDAHFAWRSVTARRLRQDSCEFEILVRRGIEPGGIGRSQRIGLKRFPTFGSDGGSHMILEKEGRESGAGEGNRTPVTSLGSLCSTIELHPPTLDIRKSAPDGKRRTGAGHRAGARPEHGSTHKSLICGAA